MKKINTTVLTLLAALTSGAQTATDPVAQPLLNADFEQSSAEQTWPAGWPQPSSASWEVENGNRYLRLTSQEPGKMVMLYREIHFPAGTEGLEIKWKQRVSGLIKGAESWHDARLMLEYMDGNRDPISTKPKPQATGADTNGWVEKELTIMVPPNARILKFMPTLMNVQAGTLDLDDITVRPVTADPVKKN